MRGRYRRDVTRPALLLTGGTSRRMGSPKAELLWRGERLADRAANVLTAVCDPVIEVGPGYTGLPVALEEPRGTGPLAALVAGVEALALGGPVGGVVVLAVDLPFVGPELIRLLADWPGDGSVVPVDDGHRQVLCARYGDDATAPAARLLAEGRRSLVALVDQVTVELVRESRWHAVAPTHAFADVDTPDDVTRWLSHVDG
jgi:molybdopterin-guanine dinucleotide biosynthesis protein A